MNFLLSKQNGELFLLYRLFILEWVLQYLFCHPRVSLFVVNSVPFVFVQTNAGTGGCLICPFLQGEVGAIRTYFEDLFFGSDFTKTSFFYCLIKDCDLIFVLISFKIILFSG